MVVDYKTGRAPGPGRERSKLAGVETYALLCERVLGVRPVAVRLLYLRAPLVVERAVGAAEVTRQERRAVEVWQAIAKAHASGSFRPSPGTAVQLLRVRRPLRGARALAGAVRRWLAAEARRVAR